MKLIFNILSIIILTIHSQESFCQIFDNSQPHPKVKWHQINTENFRLIFPSEYKKSAPTLANQINKYILYSNKTLKDSTRKIDIILQQNHIAQNGFVQLAPRKSEFFSTPSGIADNQEWLPNLALHEIRHVTQFDKLTGNLRRPFGELLAMGLFGLNLPSWFFEGDATLHETLFSNGGRGRLNAWDMEIRSNILANRNFNFNKYVHGSYKDIVPSYYTIGYFMNSELLEKDIDLTSKIFDEMKGKLIRPFNFQRALKRNYGSNANQLFYKTMQNLQQKWNEKEETNLPEPVNFNVKYPTDYLLPHIQNNQIYALEKGYQRTPRIVKMDMENQNKPLEILKIGAQVMPYFNIENHLIIWDEYRKDARFSKQTYNVINVYDIHKNKKTTITRNSRYYTPILSKDLKTIACVEVNLNNESSIAILNITNGEKIDSIALPKGTHIQQPYFNEKSSKIVAIGVSQKGTNLLEIELNTKQISELLTWTNLQFERPIYHNETIFFKVNQEGKDDIYSLKNGITKQITKSRFGAFNPYIHNDTLWFNDYTIKGFAINKLALDTTNKNNIILEKAKTLYNTQNNFKIESQTVPYSESYEIEPYNVIKNSINFHSLTLSSNDFESFDNYKPAIYWISNDVLNTTQIKLGYEREVELKKNTYIAEITYQRYYPKLKIGYKNYGNHGFAKVPITNDTVRFDFRNHQITADIQLPFSVYRGNNIYSYGVNFGTYYIKRYNYTIENLKNVVNQIRFPLNYQVYFNRNSMVSKMDLAPRWGQNFNIIYRHMPFENGTNNSIALRTNFYFPGLFLNHSFQTRFNIQHAKGVFSGNYDIPLIDGFSYLPRSFVKNTLLFDYRLPLLYPDLSISQLAYIKRIHGQFSADYLNIHESFSSPKSLSGSINFDFNLFKYTEPEFTFKAQTTYINDNRVINKFAQSFSLSYSY